MCVALAAVVVAIADGDDEDEPRPVASAAPAPRPQPRPEPPAPRPKPKPKDDKGYPEGTKDRFVEICSDRAPLDDGQCGCVYDRLHDEYSYEEFRDLVGRIDAEKRKVPREILEHVPPCRIG